MSGFKLWQSVKQKLSISSKKKPQNDGFTAISADGLDEPDPHNPKAKFKDMRLKPQGKAKAGKGKAKSKSNTKLKKPAKYTEGDHGYYCTMGDTTIAKLSPSNADIAHLPKDQRTKLQETCSSIALPPMSLMQALKVLRETDPATARDSTTMLACDLESIEISTELSVSDDSDAEYC